MTKVIYSPQAQIDLVDIVGHIALDSERQAEIYERKLTAKAERMALAPRIYTRRDDLEPGLRSAAFGKHLIFFRIVDGGIEVARVVHGARDLPALFDKK